MDTNIIPDQHPNLPQEDKVGAQYAELVHVLRDVADALYGLNTDKLAPLIVGLTLQPVHRDDDEDVEVATVDAIAAALATAGKPVNMSSGSWHYHAERTWTAARTRVAAFCRVTPPEERAAREEADRLRAEVEELRTQLAERAQPGDFLARIPTAEQVNAALDPDGAVA